MVIDLISIHKNEKIEITYKEVIHDLNTFLNMMLNDKQRRTELKLYEKTYEELRKQLGITDSFLTGVRKLFSAVRLTKSEIDNSVYKIEIRRDILKNDKLYKVCKLFNYGGFNVKRNPLLENAVKYAIFMHDIRNTGRFI